MHSSFATVRGRFDRAGVSPESSYPGRDLIDVAHENRVPTTAGRNRLLNIAHDRKLSDFLRQHFGIRPDRDRHLKRSQGSQREPGELFDAELVHLTRAHTSWKRETQQGGSVNDGKTALRFGDNSAETPRRDASCRALLTQRATVWIVQLPRKRATAVPSHAFGPQHERVAGR